MRLWHLGNTTVRSPFRLRDGLVALSTSPFQGNLRGKEQEIALRQLLGEHGIVTLGNDDTYSVGRKWRSALNKLGFLYPESPDPKGLLQSDIGSLDMITPNGWRLVRAETVPAMQECFLRALAAYYIPSAFEKDYDFGTFSPLRHTLAVMLELDNQTGDSRLEFMEMALVVQATTSGDSLPDIVASVLDLRTRRQQSPHKKKFDSTVLSEVAKTVIRLNGKPYAKQTFKDYADTNFRYLRATGLVQSKGRGLALVPERRVFIEQLVNETGIPATPKDYITGLCSGATLPTDNKNTALIVLKDLQEQIKKRGITYDITGKSLETVADIAIVRHKIEELLSEQNEEVFAAQQAGVWEEISAYMELIITRRSSTTLSNGEEISIPGSEAPAYFEWVLWRAFLAINSLKNKSYQARRFKVDQDFLPVGTAQGNGPDMQFEFEDFILVVEVTLTENSRQEAAEGEPVRRHVAVLAEESPKPVYGLFIANRIDSNTAETFRIGVWYTQRDLKLQLNIVPMTLAQFKSFFEALFKTQLTKVPLIRGLLDQCSSARAANEAPAWKTEIGRLLQKQLLSIA